MEQFTQLVERYLAIWNETEPGQRRDLIAQTWTETARYVDPLMQGEGQSGIDQMIAGVQQQFAHYQFRQAGKVDGYNDRVRFSWELVGPDGSVVVVGTDFGQVAQDGRLQSVTGFIDQAPAALLGQAG